MSDHPTHGTGPGSWRDLADRMASLLHIDHRVRNAHDNLGEGYTCSGCALLAELELVLNEPPQPDSITAATAANALAQTGHAIWGEQATTTAQVLHILTVVIGDVARAARTEQETGVRDLGALERELGNLMLTAPRLEVELGLDVGSCVEAAIEAQTAYVRRISTDTN